MAKEIEQKVQQKERQNEQKKERQKEQQKERQKEQRKGQKKEQQREAQKEQQNEEKQEFNIVKEIVGMVVYIAVVILAVWFIITFVGQRTEVSGSSMYATLEDEDNLWIDKLSYRFGDPERFDIVVFPFQQDVYYIKRIIGLPGETIRIGDDGTIYINGEPLEEDYGYETIAPNMIGRASEEIVLGEDEYFVMGDNRNDSKDSRFAEVGNIKKENLKGKAVFRIWPLSRFGKIE